MQIGPNFWWGAQQKNSYDPTTIPVQDDALTIHTPNGPVTYAGLNYRSANWSGHTGFTTVVQGAVSYVTGSHSAKFGARFHQNDSTFPKNFYNNAQLKYNFQRRRSLSADDVRGSGIGPAPAAEDLRDVCAGSLDDQPSVAAGWPALRAPGRLLRRAARSGRTIFVPTAVTFAERGRPAESEGYPAAVRRLLRRVRQRQDGGEVLHRPLRDDDQHR